MAKSFRHLVVGILPLLLGCAAQVPPKGSAEGRGRGQEQILPLVRVRLYASGVGYFERYGDVSAGQRSLPVPMGHLDDALKSLVLLSPDSEQVSLSFPSRVSPAVARARAGMAAAENAALSYDRLLAALRGEEVVLTLQNSTRLGTSEVKGRVVEVVSVEPSHPSYDHGPVGALVPKDEEKKEEVARLQLILLSRDRGVVRFDLSELVSVRPVDPRIMERFEAALSARIATRANPTEWLDMAGGGRALRNLRLGYLAEIPSWRTSYRLLMKEPGQAELQAWALIHNDTDEAWHDVKLELVDGYPSSFLFPLAAPRYQRRELITPPDELSSIPQLSTTTPDVMWGDFSDYQGEVIESIAGGLNGSGDGSAGSHITRAPMARMGSSTTTRASKARRGITTEGASDLIWVGDLARQAGVIPPAERAVSIYNVGSSLNLLPQHSALLPFLKGGVQARTIVWFSIPGSQAERAVGITNSTQNTLPQGPMAVFGQGGFLGEAVLESLQPGARQFATIGDESDFDQSTVEDNRELQRRHVDFWNGELRTHSVATTKSRWVFNNRSGNPAQVYVGVSIVNNATLEGSDRLDFDTTTGKPFAVFDVAAGAGQERSITTRQGLAQATSSSDLELEGLDELIRDRELPAEERAVLSRARVAVEQRLVTVRQQEELEVELGAMTQDLERLKEATREVSSKDSKETNALMTTRLLASHDELKKLEGKKRALDKELQSRSEALNAVLSELNASRPRLLEERRRAEMAGK
jgi:hypothetical protein